MGYNTNQQNNKAHSPHQQMASGVKSSNLSPVELAVTLSGFRGAHLLVQHKPDLHHIMG